MKQAELGFTFDISHTFASYCEANEINQAFIITDENTRKFCLPLLPQRFPVITIPPGEVSKTLATVETILGELLEKNAGRHAVIFNLGGGVVTDIGGFAASIYKRGIRYVNIPTTLLGMVDAAIGGKTGVDFQFYKNYLGTFYQPDAVLVSLQFLDTLPEEEKESAWAEVVKTALIAGKEVVRMIKSEEPLPKIIASVASLKQEICEKDPRDEDIRQLLNFGHTIGHAYESYRLSIGDPVMHGTAVAKGMLYETILAVRLGLLSDAEADRMLNLITDQTHVSGLNEEEFRGLMPFLAGDKKNRQGFIVFSLPTAIGQGAYGIKVPQADLKF